MSQAKSGAQAAGQRSLNPNFLRHAGRNLLKAGQPLGNIPRPLPEPIPFPHPILRRCQPKVLIVCDTGLDYAASNGFSLWRFVHGITEAAGVTLRPAVTLAHRDNNNGVANVTIGLTSYAVQQNFNFATATPAVDLSHYDQIWLFGDGGPAPTPAEVGVIASFMNAGGGVFATGDHGTLGFSLCGKLPRIRAMREWSAIPMGLELDAGQASQRIDTITNPGINGVYDFDDQSDTIPQRIYPKYTVVDTDGLAGTNWQASIHPLLALPGDALVKNSTDPAGVNNAFSLDIDVLPDHAHESICYELQGATVPTGNYTLNGLNFMEFQANAAQPAQRVGSTAVAYGVAGGRAIQRGAWKPPVQPRMFTIISAYDGRLAQPYAGQTQAPGRIVCDSTWHHFLNINLDGTSTNRTGLGSWSGGMPGSGVFTPSADLNKVYAYYRNAVDWLQPPNRVWCRIFVGVMGLATHPALAEELREAPHLTSWSQFVSLGRQASGVLVQSGGTQVLGDVVQGGLLQHEQSRSAGLALANGDWHKSGLNVDELSAGILGGWLVKLVEHFPDLSAKGADDDQRLEAQHHELEDLLKAQLPSLLALGLEDQARRAEGALGAARQHAQALRSAATR